MALLRKMLPQVQAVAAVGDYENDLTMLREADFSYATENAVSELKQTADVIAPHHDRDAIAFVIRDLEQRFCGLCEKQ